MPKVVSAGELEFLREVARRVSAGASLREIAREKGISAGTITYRFLKAGLTLEETARVLHEATGLPLEEALERGEIVTAPAEGEREAVPA